MPVVAERRPGPVELPRDEMAFRRQYQPLLETRILTTVFRPGDRRYPAWRGYAAGETVTARVIARTGCDEKGVPPVFNGFRTALTIREVTVRPFEALAPEDFLGSSPDVRDAASLLEHLAAIYARPLAAFGGIVTRIRFEYADPSGPDRPSPIKALPSR